jgi:hypothetical protein
MAAISEKRLCFTALSSAILYFDSRMSRKNHQKTAEMRQCPMCGDGGESDVLMKEWEDLSRENVGDTGDDGEEAEANETFRCCVCEAWGGLEMLMLSRDREGEGEGLTGKEPPGELE